jgi:hypothetical protein
MAQPSTPSARVLVFCLALAPLALAACGGKVTEVGDASTPSPSPGPTSSGPTPVPIPAPAPTPTPISTTTSMPIPVPAPTSTVTPVDAGPPVPTPPPVADASVPDVSVVVDASACVVPPGGEPCDPGVVQCGPAQCPVPATQCCVEMGSGGTIGGSCQPPSASCAGLSEACDETSDCPTGNVCCLIAQSTAISGISTQCMPSCQGGFFAVQLCRSDTECAGGQCIAQTCPEVGNLPVEACSNVPTCVPAK